MSDDPQQRQPLQRPVGADEVLDEGVSGRHQQLGRGRVLGQVPALLQHRDPVAHLDRLVDVVGDEEDRLAELGLQAQELVLKPLAVDRVDGAERLVHQHHAGVRGERAGDPDPLLLTARELGRIAVARLGPEADQLEQLGGALLLARLVPAEQGGDGGDVLGDRPVGKEADLLDHVADLAPELGGRALADGPVADEDVALGDLDHPVGHPHRGRLAAPGGADQDADLARRNLEAELVDRGALGPGIDLGHLAELDRECVLGAFAAGARARLHSRRSYPLGEGSTDVGRRSTGASRSRARARGPHLAPSRAADRRPPPSRRRSPWSPSPRSRPGSSPAPTGARIPRRRPTRPRWSSCHAVGAACFPNTAWSPSTAAR